MQARHAFERDDLEARHRGDRQALQAKHDAEAKRVQDQRGGRKTTGLVATLARGNAIFVDSRLETSVGDITVLIPRDLAINVRANVEVARREGIRSDFSEIPVTRSGDIGPREAYAEGKLNGGGPLLHIHTETGTIVIKRAP